MTDSTHQAVVTLWLVTSPNVHALMATNPSSDSEHAVQLVHALFPDKPVTPLGVFPLTRSAPAGKGEVYVGSYPGATLVQTTDIPLDNMSDLVSTWIEPDSAPHIYAFAQGGAGTWAGFAHWDNGELVRAFTATTTDIIEDVGLPLSVEGPYWAGHYPPPPDTEMDNPFAIPLPFLPGDMLLTAYTSWLGFGPRAEHLRLSVDGFAIDGRPPARPQPREVPPEESLPEAPIMGTGLSGDELNAAELAEYVDDSDTLAPAEEEKTTTTSFLTSLFKKPRKAKHPLETTLPIEPVDDSGEINIPTVTDSVDSVDDADDIVPETDEQPKETMWTRFKLWWNGAPNAPQE